MNSNAATENNGGIRTWFGRNGPLTRALTVLLVISTLAVWYIGYLASKAGSVEQRNLYLVLGDATLYLGVFGLGFLISGLQKDVYWWNLRKKKIDVLDERQQAVRRRVFELSYKVSVGVILLSTIIGSMFWEGINSIMTSELTPGGYLFTPMYGMALLLLFLPSIIATWQKDS